MREIKRFDTQADYDDIKKITSMKMNLKLMDESITIEINNDLNDKLTELLEETNNETKKDVVKSAIQYYYDSLTDKLESESERDY